MFILEDVTPRNPFGVMKKENKEYILANRFMEGVKIASQNWVHTYKGSGISRHLYECFGTKDETPVSTDYSQYDYWCNDNMDPRLSEVAVPFMCYQWTYSSKRDTYDEIGTPTINSNIDFLQAVSKWSVETTCGANDASYDVPVIRLGGVYLDYAETLCELNGGTTLAVGENEHINLLRKRVHMPTKSNWTLEEIRNERACELYLEGYRVDDVRRWAKGPEYFGDNLEGFYIGKSSSERKNIFVDSECYTVAVKYLTQEMLDTYKWVRLESGNKWLYVYADPNNLPSYDQVSSKKGPNNESGFYTSCQDPGKTIDNGAKVSEDGFFVIESKEDRTFQPRTYMMPLPVDQMILNPNLVQNPFWN